MPAVWSGTEHHRPAAIAICCELDPAIVVHICLKNSPIAAVGETPVDQFKTSSVCV